MVSLSPESRVASLLLSQVMVWVAWPWDRWYIYICMYIYIYIYIYIDLSLSLSIYIYIYLGSTSCQVGAITRRDPRCLSRGFRAFRFGRPAKRFEGLQASDGFEAAHREEARTFQNMRICNSKGSTGD